MTDFAIRDATPEDAVALISLRQAVFAQTDFMLYGPGEYSATPEEVASQLRRIAGSGHSRSLVAARSDELIGFLGVSGSSIPRLRHSASIAVGVLRQWWGRGIASSLLAEVLAWAPSAGLSRLELFVMKNNPRAIALYERAGFRVEGSRRRAYVVNHASVDDLLMARVIEL